MIISVKKCRFSEAMLKFGFKLGTISRIIIYSGTFSHALDILSKFYEMDTTMYKKVVKILKDYYK